MVNRVDRTFRRRPDRRDVDINRIHPGARSRWEIPLGGARGRGRTWLGKTHHTALRAAGGDIVPAFIGSLVKAR